MEFVPVRFFRPPALLALPFLAASVLPIAARADDSAAVQGMLDACYAGSGPCVIDLQGATKTLATTLKVDPELVTIRDAIFQCTMTSGTCLYVSEDGYVGKGRGGAHRLEGVALIGNKSADGVTMNYTDSQNYNIDAGMSLFNVRIVGFNHGITLGNNVWGVDMVNVIIGEGNIGIYAEPGTHNSGERSAFVGGTIYNNAVAGVDEEASCEIDFQGVSFDFNAQQMILAGPTSFTGHIENRDTGATEIVLKALEGVPPGSIYMSAGSTITVDQWDASAPKQACYVQTSLSGNNVVVPATLWGFGGKQGAVCGPGTVVTWNGGPPNFR
ncbi:hypothetical protein AA23498_0616 [Acetobacter nitrogenifigens DSM 23921 = NBRC 105050]|uniref:Right handed beta helix domain-containing protein n=1 Tax=Acetobacter nitrogenifigens DSM 23921 = NBRC 105050 TaxID=1120919 RepID=A0A511X879_9PROT|nr:hypothetical protein AA23498_0616 [Acetobacter nitrogenifigens DSM 23921 = NBRC 105050]GEN59139.1 hypothetical protein ANI02nite_10230 [Acetobacter nitrogenifigens DSM 23921 = NBRC 105050]